MAKYSKEDIPNLDLDTLFKVGMNLANKLVSSKLFGMTWDDLPDTNSLWDYIDEGMSAEDFIQGIKDAVDERISSEMDDMGMDSDLFEIEKNKDKEMSMNMDAVMAQLKRFGINPDDEEQSNIQSAIQNDNARKQSNLKEVRKIVRKIINEEYFSGPIVDVDGVSDYFVNKIKREGENYIEIKDEIIKTARGDKSVVKDIFSAIGKKLKASGDKKLYSIGQVYDSDMFRENKFLSEKKYSDSASKFIGKEISHLMKDKGYDHDRAVAAAINVAKKKGYKVPANESINNSSEIKDENIEKEAIKISNQLMKNPDKLLKAVDIIEDMGVSQEDIENLLKLSPNQQMEYLKDLNLTNESYSGEEEGRKLADTGVATVLGANIAALGLNLTGLTPLGVMLFAGGPFVVGVIMAIQGLRMKKRGY